MKLTFLGANHEVTGSCTLLQACGKNILVDCGMEQGIDIYENQPLPIAPGEVDAILLTHAHMDHAGRIPLMYKQGPIPRRLANCWPLAVRRRPSWPPAPKYSRKKQYIVSYSLTPWFVSAFCRSI